MLELRLKINIHFHVKNIFNFLKFQFLYFSNFKILFYYPLSKYFKKFHNVKKT